MAAKDWLYSFANADWSRLGTLSIHAETKELTASSVALLNETEIKTELKAKLFYFAYGAARCHLRKCEDQPHPRLFLLILNTIKGIPIESMNHDLAKACLIISLLANDHYREISWIHEDTKSAITFFEGLNREPSLGPLRLTNVPNPLSDIKWNVREQPWMAKVGENAVELDQEVAELLSGKFELIVQDPVGEGETYIAVSGTTTYDILKAIFDFHKYYGTYILGAYGTESFEAKKWGTMFKGLSHIKGNWWAVNIG